MPVIKKIPNKIEQAFWIQQLARKLNVKEENIEEELKKTKIEGSFYAEPTASESQAKIAPKTRKELLEERLLTLILKAPQHLVLVNKEIVSSFLSKTQKIINNFGNRKKLSPKLNTFLAYLGLKADIEKIEEKDIISEIKFCLKELQSIQIKGNLNQISLEIKKAEEEKNPKEVGRLSKKFNQWTKKIVTS